MSSSCKGLLAAMRDCVMRSDCVVKDGNKPSDCLRNHTDELPDECKMLRKATFECKRGMMDMRNRFRGNVGAQYQFTPGDQAPESFTPPS